MFATSSSPENEEEPMSDSWTTGVLPSHNGSASISSTFVTSRHNENIKVRQLNPVVGESSHTTYYHPSISSNPYHRIATNSNSSSEDQQQNAPSLNGSRDALLYQSSNHNNSSIANSSSNSNKAFKATAF